MGIAAQLEMQDESRLQAQDYERYKGIPDTIV
jgi:hypothetical protein